MRRAESKTCLCLMFHGYPLERGKLSSKDAQVPEQLKAEFREKDANRHGEILHLGSLGNLLKNHKGLMGFLRVFFKNRKRSWLRPACLAQGLASAKGEPKDRKPAALRWNTSSKVVNYSNRQIFNLTLNPRLCSRHVLGACRQISTPIHF